MVKPPNRSEYGGVAYNETITAGKGKANTHGDHLHCGRRSGHWRDAELGIGNKGFHTVTCMDGLRAVDVPHGQAGLDIA